MAMEIKVEFLIPAILHSLREEDRTFSESISRFLIFKLVGR